MKNEDNIIRLTNLNKNIQTAKERSSELLEEAYFAETEAKAKKLVKEALKVDPDNIEASLFLLDFEKSLIKKFDLINQLQEKEKKNLELNDYFDKENIGEFWLIYETRDYMRILDFKIQTLVNLNRYSDAIAECEYALKLCEDDNLGIRYTLFELYCLLEKNTEFLKLFSKYDDGSAEIYFIKSILHYKKGEYNLVKQTIKELKHFNPMFLHLFLDYEPDDIIEYVDLDDLDEYEIEDFMHESAQIIMDHMNLIDSVPYYKELLKSYYKKCY